MCLQLRKQGSKAVQLFKELIQLVGMALEVMHSQISLSCRVLWSFTDETLQNLKVKPQARPSYLPVRHRIDTVSPADKSGQRAADGTCPGHGRATGGARPPPTWVGKIHAGRFGPFLTDPVAKTPYGFSAPCLQCVHWMTSHSQTWPKMCLCELMNWFNCLPNLRAAKSNKLKFTILWSHLQGDNTATVYFVRCWSESGENYSPYVILIIIIIIKILLIGNTDSCFAPLTCTIVSARLAADSAGQGVLIPRRQNWLHSHNSWIRSHGMAVAGQHPCEDLQGQKMLYGAGERAPGEEGDARVPGSCWETSWPMSPAWRGRAEEGGGSSSSAVFGRRASCTLCEVSVVPRDGGAGSARHEPQLKRHKPATKRSGWPPLRWARIISGFQPISSCRIRSPDRIVPSCVGCPALGRPVSSSPRLQRGGGLREGLWHEGGS